MGTDDFDDGYGYASPHVDDRPASPSEDDEGPIRGSRPVLPCLGCSVFVLLIVVGTFGIMLNSMGFFVMGTAGIVSMYLKAVCCCLIIAMLAVPVVGGIIAADKLLTKLLASVAAVAVTVLVAWIFVVNPILDIPYLASPSTVELEDVSFGSENVNDSVFFKFSGTDAEGRELTFDIDRGFADTWDPADGDAIVTYLPHSETVLSIE